MDKQEGGQMKYLGKLDLEDPNTLQRLGKGKIKTHISLFSGCGGLDCGFGKAGIQTRLMIEFNHDACETLRTNFHWEELKNRRHGHYENLDGTPLKGGAIIGKVKWVDDDLVWKNKEDMKKDIDWYHEPEPVIFERDIKEVTTNEILEASKLEVGECSIISGGFPCQGFSAAGKRIIDDPRNALYKEFVRIVNEIKPAMIMGENVPGLVSMGKGVVIKQICEDFANCGYDISWNILNAADYGVPQNRKRIILIGKRVDMMRFDENDKPSYHIAACPGEITHPHLFKERLKRWKQFERLEAMEKDPQIKFAEKKK